MATGTLIDFLQLATENEALRSDPVALASKHGFTFRADELGDEDLDEVSGGIVMDNGSALTSGIKLSSGRLFSPGAVQRNLGALESLSKILGVEPTTFPSPK